MPTRPPAACQGGRVTRPAPPRTPAAALAVFAVAIVLGHHVGTFVGPLGIVGPTEWADWVDLLVPFAVLGSAALVLAAVDATRQDWVGFGVGVVAYVQGHGIHLAANSINNAAPVGRAEDAAHLWDEVIGHYIWYAGLAIVFFVLLQALLRAGAPSRLGLVGHVLAALVGLTWTTNAIEGGTVALSAFAAIMLLLRARSDLAATAGRAAALAFGLSIALLAVWGTWHGGFPQFSELGWI